MMSVYPSFIMPMFNKFTPLPDGELKDRIVSLCKGIDYPLKKMYIIDGSKRSSHSNAFMFGFGSNKRIVLFDTLLDQVDNDEIVSIVGHELGHWALSHTMYNFIITQVYFAIAFYSFGFFYTENGIYSSFGFEGSAPTIVKLLLFTQTIWSPVDKIISFLLTLHSRSCEYAADHYSNTTLGTTSLRSALVTIQLENLGSLKCDWLYSMYHHSHPTLKERLARMDSDDKKVD